MQRNFFLTDLMKTGNHMSYERFLRTHSLPNQTIEYTGEYYTLHNYDLDSYDRRFALIDRRIDNTVLYGNKEYYNELDRRVKLLHSQGFKFIMASPWESIENLKSGKIHPNDIGNVNSFNWTGVLAEPSPQWHEALKKNRKHSKIITNCIWKESEKTLDF